MTKRNATIGAVLPEISHGDHCCLLFTSPAEQVAVTAPFLALGLERDERAVFVATADEIDRVRTGLREAGLDIDREVERGRLAFVSEREYLEDGKWSTEKMLGFLQRAYEETLAQGFTGLRAAGDVLWQVGPDRDFRDVVYYETLLDVFFVGKRMVGMCEYAREQCPPEVLSGILGSHKIAAVGQEVCQNFHYLPPGLLLEKDVVAREHKRTEWMTSQLLRARRAEEEILRLNRELEDRVRARTAALEAINRDLESFSYSVSHDLKAPLRAIRGYAELLRDAVQEGSPEEIERCLGVIDRSAQRMGGLIDGLLAYGRLAQAELQPEPVELEAVIAEVLGRFSEDIRKSGAEIHVTRPLGQVLAHRLVLTQVVENLLTNALKFVAPGVRPEIRIRTAAEGDRVRLWVQDNGIGIPAEQQARIFGGFQRLHSQAEYPGSGVGLSIVKRAAEKMGGTAGVESEPGKGSSFFVELRGAAGSGL